MPVKKFFDYFILLSLIAVSGFYYFYSNIEYIVIGTILVFLLLLFSNKLRQFDTNAILIIFAFVSWEVVQNLILGGIELRPILGTASRFLFAYGVIKLLEKKFIPYYINLIVVFTVISFFFYTLYIFPNITNEIIQLSKNIKPVFEVDDPANVGYRPNIIIFNFHGFEFTPKRNSGPFWEPGAFAIFLNLALYFHLVIKQKLIGFKSLVLIAGVITTLSTTGILVLFVIMTWYFYQLKIKLLFRIVFLVPTLILFTNIYTDYDFLGQKIQENIENAPVTTSSRFGSALADWQMFKQNPILGYSRNNEAKYGFNYFDVTIMHRNNGLTNFLVQWGLIFGVAYFLLYYRSFNHFVRYYHKNIKYTTFAGYIILLLCGFSQGIFQFPFFHALMLMGMVVYKRSEIQSQITTTG